MRSAAEQRIANRRHCLFFSVPVVASGLCPGSVCLARINLPVYLQNVNFNTLWNWWTRFRAGAPE